jgi:hypothetical protein
MDLVTVTFDRDFDQLLLLAHSIDKFVLDTCDHWIIVERTAKTMSEWETALQPFYTRHRLHLINSQSDEFQKSVPIWHRGYFRQQIFKLKIVELLNSDYYIILDSKDLVIKEMKFQDWSLEEGYFTVVQSGIDHGHEVYVPWAELIEKATGITRPEWFWNNITPFKCKSSVVRKILDTVDLDYLFLTGGTHPSEFLLYRYFSDAELNLTYWENRQSQQFWHNETIEDFERCLSSDIVTMVSIHRFFIPSNPITITTMREYLTSLGLDKTLVFNALDITYWTDHQHY